MENGCLICGSELEYLDSETEMTCAICGKKYMSRARCGKGHYVCDGCHTKGMDTVVRICLSEASRNPIEILDKLMSQEFCHMHGPEHHVLVGASLLTAYRNSGGNIDLEASLKEIISRGSSVPGGACGFWGACGAGISTGMFVSIVTGSTPLAGEPWSLSNEMTSLALSEISKYGGPRCCKRDSYTAILTAVEFCKRNLGVNMESTPVHCAYSPKNRQCLGERCPYHS